MMSKLVLAVLVLHGLSCLVDSRPLAGSSPTTRALRSNALSSSVATGNSSVTTTSIALNGGSAVAQQTGDSGTLSKTVIAVGKETVVLTHNSKPAGATPGTSFEAAPPCPFSPTASNSVKDQSGRHWGWHHNASCAFKQPLNHTGPSWETAPACPDSLSASSGVKDLSGRLWGWHNNASCAFKQAAKVPLPGNATSSHNRKLLTGGEPGLTVSAQEALDPDTPAEQLLHPTVTTAVVGTGNDSTVCKYVSMPDPTTGEQFTQLKCDKADSALDSITGTIATVDATASSSATTTVAAPTTNSVASPPPAGASASEVAPSPQPTTNSVASPSPVLPDASDASVSNTTSSAPSASVPVPTAVLTPDAGSTVVNRFGITWEAAPACTSKPSKRTAVQDTLGRLWWYEGGLSCAYRDAQGASISYDGYVQVKWETAPACKGTPTLINSMADAEGRLWGWVDTEGGQNCRFMSGSGGNKAATHEGLLQAVIASAAADSTELKP